MKNVKTFEQLNLGDTFDWTASEYPSFFDTCVKTGKRTYQSTMTLAEYRVGSVKADVNYIGHDSSFEFASKR
jgi:hypothetical protein